MVRTPHKIGQRRHHARAHLDLALAAKLPIEVAPRALGHKHHALGLKVAKEPLTQPSRRSYAKPGHKLAIVCSVR